jgi:ataxia telangiectasia mutated family protein
LKRKRKRLLYILNDAIFRPTGFQDVLSTIIENTALEHPYHTLYQIFALANGGRVLPEQRGSARFVVDQDKIAAAKSM